MNTAGLALGAGAFLVIALLHPLVAKAFDAFNAAIWPLFLIGGLGCIAGSLFFKDPVVSGLLGILGFCLLWSINELFELQRRLGDSSKPDQKPKAAKVCKTPGRNP